MVYGGYSELAGSLFISVKIDGLGNFLEQLTIVKFDSLWASKILLERIPY